MKRASPKTGLRKQITSRRLLLAGTAVAVAAVGYWYISHRDSAAATSPLLSTPQGEANGQGNVGVVGFPGGLTGTHDIVWSGAGSPRNDVSPVKTTPFPSTAALTNGGPASGGGTRHV